MGSSVVELRWFQKPLDSALAALASVDPALAPVRGPRIGRPGKVPTQVRGVLAERVDMTVPLDPYLSLKALARYSGISVRKLRHHLTDPVHPLPCYRIEGKLLVRRSEYDGWTARYRQVGNVDVNKLVADALSHLRGAA